MNLIISFPLGLSASDRDALNDALQKLVADCAIDRHERRPPHRWRAFPEDDEEEYEVQIGFYASAREFSEEKRIAGAVAKAITDALPRAGFTIVVVVEHGCTGCGHQCSHEETIWSTYRPPTPEERAVFKYAMELDHSDSMNVVIDRLLRATSDSLRTLPHTEMATVAATFDPDLRDGMFGMRFRDSPDGRELVRAIAPVDVERLSRRLRERAESLGEGPFVIILSMLSRSIGLARLEAAVEPLVDAVTREFRKASL